ALLQTTLDLASGGHVLDAVTADQTLTSLGDDMMIGSATGATTFALKAIYSADTIANFAGGDSLLLPAVEFAQLQNAIHGGNYAGGNAVLSFADGDTLPFDG